MDSSGSIGRRNWERMKTFIKHIIRKFEVAPGKTHVAVIEYSTNAAVNFKFNTLDDKAVSPSHYDELVEKMKWQRGYTYIDKALLLANTDMFHESAGMREDVQKVQFRDTYAITLDCHIMLLNRDGIAIEVF